MSLVTLFLLEVLKLYLEHGSLHQLGQPLPVGGPPTSGILPAGLYFHMLQASSFPPTERKKTLMLTRFSFNFQPRVSDPDPFWIRF